MEWPTYEQSAFEGEKPFCDIVMKGGITSGVVYPLTVVELAKKYRLHSIGGTSAGALAAAITAAAEYGRSNGGYQRIAEIPQEIAVTLLDKFQPEPEFRPLFSMLVATLGEAGRLAKVGRALLAAARGYWRDAAFGAATGLAIAAAGIATLSIPWTLFGLLLAALGAVGFLSRRIVRAVTKQLPAANYGMCTGKTVPGSKALALTDWLADTIDRVAGLEEATDRSGRPLTFGDLKAPPTGGHTIELAMMTTDLSMRRPYRLPFSDNIHFFSKADFARLFPERVLKHMLDHTNPLPAESNPTGDLHYFPGADDLPIVVAARMSLSFPGLIQAVPIYKRDFTLLKEEDKQRPIKCLFSDGGLSSNFPIHFFDHLWPNTPTFAIALEGFSEKRHGTGEDQRVRIASAPGDGQLLPIQDIKGLGGFLMTLLDAAKDWQDNLQSILAGYRERVVHIALKDDEGGLNLTMPAPLIHQLTAFGKQAGELAASEFDLDDHRWRRFLIAMAEIEETLDQLANSYEGPKTATEGFGAFLQRYQHPRSYRPESPEWKDEALKRATALAELGRRWRGEPRIRNGTIPKPECNMRITPRY